MNSLRVGAMSEVVGLEFQGPDGESLRFEWDAEELGALAASEALSEPAWRLGGELDWDVIDTVRVVSARLGDDRLLAIAAIRPAGSEGHGNELVAGAIGNADGFEQLDEALVSLEYGPDEMPRRLGLELHRADAMAIRVAGDATAVESSREGSVHRLSAAFAMRSSGEPGAGRLDVLSADI